MKKYLAAISAIVIAASSFGFSALNVSAADSTVDASIGTDSADDTSALQRAINQGEGGTVNIPAGTYYINGPLRVKSNTHIILDDGARIVRTDDSQYMLSYAGVDSTSSGYDKLSNVTIEGGVWDGNPTNTSTNAKGLVLIRNANNITLKNTTFQNCCGTHFLLFEGVSDITMTGCTVKNFIPFTGSESTYKTATKADYRYRTTEAVHLDYINSTPCQNVTIQNNYFENLTTAIGTHAHASDTGSENYSTGIDVENNTFQNCSFYGLDAAYFTDFIFSWNTLTDCGGMVYAQHSTGTISNNSLKSAVPSSSMYTYLDEIPTDGVHAKMNSSLTIMNNLMSSVNGYAIRAKENSTIKYADNNGDSSTKDDGTVTFEKVSSGTPVPKPANFSEPDLTPVETTMFADINGDSEVNVKDTLRLQKYINGDAVMIADLEFSDINGDGTISIKDVIRLQKMLNGDFVDSSDATLEFFDGDETVNLEGIPDDIFDTDEDIS